MRKALRVVRVSFEQKSNSRSWDLSNGDFDLANYPSINNRLLNAIERQRKFPPFFTVNSKNKIRLLHRQLGFVLTLFFKQN
jgi:hypothetical protein